MTTDSGIVPDKTQSSNAALAALEALIRAGKEPGRDFSYHPRSGGRKSGNEIDIDFLFSSPPDLAMQVQESFYSHHSGIETRGTDVLARAQLAGQGVTLVMLDHDKLMQDPDWLIAEALQYRDHSWE
jgi:hypothetical protein